jgi:hypothetical protein
MIRPYHDWLGIPDSPAPPTPYQLLGVPVGEADPDVLEKAALRRMAVVRAMQHAYPEESSKVQGEIARALVLLTDLARTAVANDLTEALGTGAVRHEAKKTAEEPCSVWRVRLERVPLGHGTQRKLARWLRKRSRLGKGSSRAVVLQRKGTEMLVALPSRTT